MEGGRQEGDRRAGTENLPAIVGFGVAAEEWKKRGDEFREDVAQAQKVLAEGILKEVPSAKLHGSKLGLERSPNHLAFSFAGLEAESLALVLDRVGLAVRGGSGCVTREMRIPPGMRAIGAKPEEARALILFTLATEMDPEKISKAVDLVKEAVQRLTSALPS
jgi:cysteine desulfurase